MRGGATLFGTEAGFLPFWLGASLAGLALLLLVRTIATREETGGQALAVPKEAGWRVARVLAALVAYALLLERLGYLLSTFLLFAFLIGVVGRQPWRMALGVAALLSLGFLALFQWWLQLPLPRGFWPF